MHLKKRLLVNYPATYSIRAVALLCVDTYCTVRFDTNNYSVPISHCGHEVAVKAYGTKVVSYYRNAIIAKHNRCYGKKQTIYELAHYLILQNFRPWESALECYV